MPPTRGRREVHRQHGGDDGGRGHPGDQPRICAREKIINKNKKDDLVLH